LLLSLSGSLGLASSRVTKQRCGCLSFLGLKAQRQQRRQQQQQVAAPYRLRLQALQQRT
jgi:hypothetical protein